MVPAYVIRLRMDELTKAPEMPMPIALIALLNIPRAPSALFRPMSKLLLSSPNLTRISSDSIIFQFEFSFVQIVDEIHLDKGKEAMAPQGELFAFAVSRMVRRGDKVFRIVAARD